MSTDVERAKYDTEARTRMAKNGQAMPDGSYPIADREDLSNAISAVGRGSGSHDAIRRHIMKRARALGLMSMIPDNWMSDGSMRAELAPTEWTRRYPLEDIRILSRSQGVEYADGRTVEALVAVWDREAPIADHEGRYLETIARTGFDKAINDARPQGSRQSWKVGVFYNHGMTLHGTPSERGSVPLGSPIDIRADPAGLVTVTRYNQTPWAEEILETIRAGDITGHSFTGRIVKSTPAHPPRGGWRPGKDGELQVVKRLELGLREYGPTPFPAYTDTAVLGVRNVAAVNEDVEWLATDVPATRVYQDPDTSSDEEAVTDEPPAVALEPEPDLARHALLQKIAMARRTRPGLTRQEESDQ